MSPVTVFFRTLLKSSAIFVGAAAIVLNPGLEWRSASQATGSALRGTIVGAQQAGSEAAIDGLVAALKDTDAGVRRAAVNALAELNSRRAVPALSAALKDGDPELRGAIATALGEIGDRDAVDALIGAVKDKSPDVRKRAITSLGEIGARIRIRTRIRI